MLVTQKAGDYIINNVGFPSTLLKNQMYFEKLRGMYAIRANVKIRVQVNATRFQAGRLLIYYLPTPNYSSYRKLAGDLYNTTQLPKVEIDIATESEVTFEVPFVAPWSHCLIPGSTSETKYEIFDFASIAMQVYSPLLDPSSSPVNITVWASFTDVDFVLPAIAQSRDVKIRGRRSRAKVTPEEEEFGETEYNGKLSQPLSTISEVSSKLAGIPILSSVAGPVSWASAIGADIASAFGYCKPFEHDYSVVKQSVMHHNLNIDDKITGHVGALEVQNKISHLPNFAGNLQDEMAFDYLVTKSSLLTTANWTTTSDDSKALLWLHLNADHSHYDHLQRMLNPPTTPGSTLIRGPVYGHLARQFRFFRGGFKYKLKFIKTEFHSGRLEILFNPHVIRSGSPDNWDSQWLHRDIIDIRGLTEYEFSIPYVSPMAYTKTNNSFGTVVVKIINKLVAPNTVSQNVPIIVECSALPGFEVAIPHNLWMYNADNETTFNTVEPIILPQSRGREFDIEFFDVVIGKAQVYFQGGVTSDEIVDKSDKKETAQLGMAHLNDSSKIAEQTIGERILSVRQLIKRPTQIGYADFSTVFANGTNVAIDDNLTAAQWDYLPTGQRRYSALRFFGNWFSYRRGGTILRINPIDNGVFSMTYATIPGQSGTGLKWLSVQSSKNAGYRASNSGFISMERVDLSGSLDVRIPYYKPLPFDVTNYKALDDKIPTVFNRFLFGGRVAGTSSDTQRVDVYQCAADDFSFGFFTSTGYSCYSTADWAYDTSGPETQHNSGAFGVADVNIVGVQTEDILNTAASAPIAVSQNGSWNVNSSVTNGTLNVNANIVAVDSVGVDKDLGVPIQLKTAATTIATNSNITNTNLSVTSTPTGIQNVNINNVDLPVNISRLGGQSVFGNQGLPIKMGDLAAPLKVDLTASEAVDVNLQQINGKVMTNVTPTLPIDIQRVGSEPMGAANGIPVHTGSGSIPLWVDLKRINGKSLVNNGPQLDVNIGITKKVKSDSNSQDNNYGLSVDALPVCIVGPTDNVNGFYDMRPATVRSQVNSPDTFTSRLLTNP